MEKAGIAYSISLEFGQTEAIKNGVASGLVVSCLSLVAVQLELEYDLLMEVTSTLIPGTRSRCQDIEKVTALLSGSIMQ